MGVGGGFWDNLRQVKKNKELEWLRGKRLAIDLSYWIVQQQSALNGRARKPHLRVLFFRVVNLISRELMKSVVIDGSLSLPEHEEGDGLILWVGMHKTGALPVFIVDGNPPPEKLQVQMERFSRLTNAPMPFPDSQGASTAELNRRHGAFQKSNDECVELLKLLGMPVLQAKWEAEGLCAELNREGWVDACVTPDSDVFLHGANCVVKYLQADPKDPLVETYTSEDIQTTLGLQRQHMIALALLVGCDYDTKGVSGIGCSHAMRLVSAFPNEEILDRLREWGRCERPSTATPEVGSCSSSQSEGEGNDDSNSARRKIIFKETPCKVLQTARSPFHCTNCGHPGKKREHSMSGCLLCKRPDNGSEVSEFGCLKKAQNFQCMCKACVKALMKSAGSDGSLSLRCMLKIRKVKSWRKQRDWWGKYRSKIAMTPGFPNEHIIDIFLRPGLSNLADVGTPASLINWRTPNVDLLEDFMLLHLHWDHHWVRQHILPLLSTICLKSLAAKNQLQQQSSMIPLEDSIVNQFIPHSIQRVKKEHFKEFYLLRWQSLDGFAAQQNWLGLKENDGSQEESQTLKKNVSIQEGEGFDDPDVEGTKVDSTVVESGEAYSKCVFTTVEEMALVEVACPGLVEAFEQDQAMKEMKKAMKKWPKRKKDERDASQLSIESFFKAKKVRTPLETTKALDLPSKSSSTRPTNYGVPGGEVTPDGQMTLPWRHQTYISAEESTPVRAPESLRRNLFSSP